MSGEWTLEDGGNERAPARWWGGVGLERGGGSRSCWGNQRHVPHATPGLLPQPRLPCCETTQQEVARGFGRQQPDAMLCRVAVLAALAHASLEVPAALCMCPPGTLLRLLPTTPSSSCMLPSSLAQHKLCLRAQQRRGMCAPAAPPPSSDARPPVLSCLRTCPPGPAPPCPAQRFFQFNLERIEPPPSPHTTTTLSAPLQAVLPAPAARRCRGARPLRRRAGGAGLRGRRPAPPAHVAGRHDGGPVRSESCAP